MTNQELLKIAGEYGTPVYVYETEKIREQYEKLTKSFDGKTRFFYAAKALTNINILKYIQKLGANIDCVSIHEVNLGLKAGFTPEKILFTPNCVDITEIEEAMKLGVHINIDNISILEQFGNKYGNSYPVFIRINPHIFAGGNYKISTGHIDSKFGISIHQLRHIQRIVKTTGLRVEGLHMHTGSEIKDIDVFIQGLEIMFEMVEDFPDLKYIDMGSGFKVPYQEGELETDVKTLGKKVLKAVNDFKKESGKDFELWFEPGKYLVSECGHFLVRANVIKQTTATVFVGVNSGFNHLIRPMFYDSYHKIENLSNPNGPERIYTVVGNICETDTFAWDRKINEVREGDVLVFRNAGAYGFEMSSNFNSRLKPAEVMVMDGKVHLIRKRDVFEDLLKNQIEVL
ncbi:diaminopimelate decarboxylase [Elizabethkingia meningoseptica]|uniref:Diaminopimelate decarboxylase n=1 Tax=Elizabethkingia meningoseptica TaxID=238 RepID=A0A1V3TYR6_ELIME|nr:diaminopimelate decarboxylase [Elizabethkingia meningoseptica]EOR30802.1 diaminopimelate decarboxylase [Elizabethkingia meningoseptica ATCC 13253 = NBRC 12535]AQX04243.1 diaminopimelate decarboxylase [Elizabethkingia meningoseptica]AQX11704.1 diaminopimelate decarboxylase [Elizabethkingia meningoseptica]AQX46284.1 diaminopimelate decarboxylase [Elizabethkingia meningoseptica]EJK5330232.1 diaminopimelate decarboxylase [Elizabethkingia meningoseptica]